MLPSELDFVLDLLGYDWPNVNEDEVRRAAEMVRRFRDDLDDTVSRIDRMVDGDLRSAFTSKTVIAYADSWTDTRGTYIAALLDLIGPAADGIDLIAEAIVAMKIKVIAELAITAAQIASAAATAVFTAGLSVAGNLAIIIARKKALDMLTDYIMGELMGYVLGLVIEPLTEGATSLITGLIETPVVQGSLADAAEYAVDIAALESMARELDTNGSDQQMLGQEFIAEIMSLDFSAGS